MFETFHMWKLIVLTGDDQVDQGRFKPPTRRYNKQFSV